MILRIQEFLKKLGQTLLGLIKVLLLSRSGSEVKYLPQERDAVILLNGPSLNELVNKHSDFLKDKDLFSVNFFPLSEIFEKVKPAYFVISAPELWMEDVDSVYIEKRNDTFMALKNKATWPLQILIPFAASKSGIWETHLKSNKNLTIKYYNDTGIEGFRRIVFWFFRQRLAMPRPHNVLVPSLINSINLGYKKIFLWGAENNQFLDLKVNDNNVALIHQKHFYDQGKTRPAAMRKLGKGQRKVHEILYKFMLSFAAYHEIEEYAKTRDCRIINQTPGSLIDAFEREKL